MRAVSLPQSRIVSTPTGQDDSDRLDRLRRLAGYFHDIAKELGTSKGSLLRDATRAPRSDWTDMAALTRDEPLLSRLDGVLSIRQPAGAALNLEAELAAARADQDPDEDDRWLAKPDEETAEDPEHLGRVAAYQRADGMIGAQVLGGFEKDLIYGWPLLAGTVEKKRFRAPLFIAPVQGERTEVGLRFARSEDVQFNIHPWLDLAGNEEGKLQRLREVAARVNGAELNDAFVAEILEALCVQFPELRGAPESLQRLMPLDEIGPLVARKPGVAVFPAAVLFRTPKPNHFTLADLKEMATGEDPGLFGDQTGLALGDFLFSEDVPDNVDLADLDRAETQLSVGDVYFPFPSNDKQRQIALALDRGARLLTVDGPPGTGKSHTIANLVCHLAMTGKSVLIASEKPEALRVVDDKLRKTQIDFLHLALMRDDTEAKRAFVRKVNGVTAHVTGLWVDRLEAERERLESQRQSAADELRRLEQRFVEVVAKGSAAAPQYEAYGRLREFDCWAPGDSPVTGPEAAELFDGVVRPALRAAIDDREGWEIASRWRDLSPDADLDEIAAAVDLIEQAAAARIHVDGSGRGRELYKWRKTATDNHEGRVAALRAIGEAVSYRAALDERQAQLFDWWSGHPGADLGATRTAWELAARAASYRRCLTSTRHQDLLTWRRDHECDRDTLRDALESMSTAKNVRARLASDRAEELLRWRATTGSDVELVPFAAAVDQIHAVLQRAASAPATALPLAHVLRSTDADLDAVAATATSLVQAAAKRRQLTTPNRQVILDWLRVNSATPREDAVAAVRLIRAFDQSRSRLTTRQREIFDALTMMVSALSEPERAEALRDCRRDVLTVRAPVEIRATVLEGLPASAEAALGSLAALDAGAVAEATGMVQKLEDTLTTQVRYQYRVPIQAHPAHSTDTIKRALSTLNAHAGRFPKFGGGTEVRSARQVLKDVCPSALDPNSYRLAAAELHAYVVTAHNVTWARAAARQLPTIADGPLLDEAIASRSIDQVRIWARTTRAYLDAAKAEAALRAIRPTHDWLPVGLLLQRGATAGSSVLADLDVAIAAAERHVEATSCVAHQAVLDIPAVRAAWEGQGNESLDFEALLVDISLAYSITTEESTARAMPHVDVALSLPPVAGAVDPDGARGGFVSEHLHHAVTIAKDLREVRALPAAKQALTLPWLRQAWATMSAEGARLPEVAAQLAFADEVLRTRRSAEAHPGHQDALALPEVARWWQDLPAELDIDALIVDLQDVDAYREAELAARSHEQFETLSAVPNLPAAASAEDAAVVFEDLHRAREAFVVDSRARQHACFAEALTVPGLQRFWDTPATTAPVDQDLVPQTIEALAAIEEAYTKHETAKAAPAYEEARSIPAVEAILKTKAGTPASPLNIEPFIRHCRGRDAVVQAGVRRTFQRLIDGDTAQAERLLETGFGDALAAHEARLVVDRVEADIPDRTDGIVRRIRDLTEGLGDVNRQLLDISTKLRLFHLERGSQKRHLGALAKAVGGRARKSQRMLAFDELRRDFDWTTLLTLVPVWLMSLEDVARITPMTAGLFDVVIIDEASQCTVPQGMPTMLRGKQALIFGDEQQLKPSNTRFLSQEKSGQLMRKYGLHELRYGTLLDVKDSSLLSFAKMRAERSVMLDEHFRCLPEIIEYSRMKFYATDGFDGFRVMTDSANPPIRPVLSNHLVSHAQDDTEAKWNEDEARALVEDLHACLKSPEWAAAKYDVAVLSPSTKQAKLLQVLIDDLVPAKLIERHRIAVSTFDGFQGNERDVIFYSFRYAPNSSANVLNHVEREPEKANVGFSRARLQVRNYYSAPLDQMPNGHIRDWLRYCEDPAAGVEHHNGDQFDSEFERKVCYAFRDQGLKVQTQYKTCGYRIDLVVDDGDRRLAVECDGTYWHEVAPGILKDSDLKRQDVLERAGWQVHRISDRDWALNPDDCVEDVLKALGRAPRASSDENCDVCGGMTVWSDGQLVCSEAHSHMDQILAGVSAGIE